MDDVNRALGVSLEIEYVQEVAEAAITEIGRLQCCETALMAKPATSMERMLYLVAPTQPVSDSEQFCGLITTTKLFLASERRE
jgi:hypothetical protein